MLNWKDEMIVDKVVNLLSKDEVVLSSSDTVLGLFAQLSEIGKKKIDFIKKRSDKPYLILFASSQDLSHYVDEQSLQHKDVFDKYWPGPVTFILKAHQDLPSWMISEQGTIAVRVPNHQRWLDILKKSGPLFSTSANLTGQPVPVSLDQVDEVIIKQVQTIAVDDSHSNGVTASTIVDLTQEVPNVIRQGSVIFE